MGEHRPGRQNVPMESPCPTPVSNKIYRCDSIACHSVLFIKSSSHCKKSCTHLTLTKIYIYILNNTMYNTCGSLSRKSEAFPGRKFSASTGSHHRFVPDHHRLHAAGALQEKLPASSRWESVQLAAHTWAMCLIGFGISGGYGSWWKLNPAHSR